MWQKMSVLESESAGDTAGGQPAQAASGASAGTAAGWGRALATEALTEARPKPDRRLQTVCRPRLGAHGGLWSPQLLQGVLRPSVETAGPAEARGQRDARPHLNEQSALAVCTGARRSAPKDTGSYFSSPCPSPGTTTPVTPPPYLVLPQVCLHMNSRLWVDAKCFLMA